MKQRCIDQQTPPDMEPGAYVDRGEFFRNLKRKHVTKRYENDNDDNPQYGFKLSSRYWKDANQQGEGLSVNLCSCMHSEKCSIALHPGKEGEHYFHVAIINLAEMNGCGLLTSSLIAQYSPVEETCNRCHFDIMPLDGTVLKWMELRVLLDNPFPSRKKPVSAVEESRVTVAYTQYRQYCDIHHWVRSRDGMLVP